MVAPSTFPETIVSEKHCARARKRSWDNSKQMPHVETDSQHAYSRKGVALTGSRPSELAPGHTGNVQKIIDVQDQNSRQEDVYQPVR